MTAIRVSENTKRTLEQMKTDTWDTYDQMINKIIDDNNKLQNTIDFTAKQIKEIEKGVEQQENRIEEYRGKWEDVKMDYDYLKTLLHRNNIDIEGLE